MMLRLLGPVTADVDLGPARQRAVLAMLALRLNQPVSRDEIIDGVWGEDLPPSAANLVATYVARLRRLLEPDRARRAASTVLVSTTTGYELRLPLDQVDVYEFERLAAGNQLDAALALWGGQPLDGITGPFAQVQRQRLVDRYLTVFERRVADGLDRDEDWTYVLTRLVAEHPYRERLRVLLITALQRAGQSTEAVAAYQSARRTLADDLGVQPGRELRRAYRRVLAEPDQAQHYVDRVRDADLMLRPGRGAAAGFESYDEAMTWLEHRWQAIVSAGVEADDPTLPAELATHLRAFMHRRGHWTDLRRLAAAAAAGDHDRAGAQGHLELGGVDYLRGRLEQADAHVSPSLTLFRMLGDVPGIMRALNNLSMIRADRGLFVSAAGLADEHLSLCESLADHTVALDNLALIAVRRGQFTEAVQHCTHSMEIHRELGSSLLASAALNLLGLAYCGLGEPERGASFLRSSIKLARLGRNLHRERQAQAALTRLSPDCRTGC